MWCFVLVLGNRRLCLERMLGIVPGVGCENMGVVFGWTCCYIVS